MVINQVVWYNIGMAAETVNPSFLESLPLSKVCSGFRRIPGWASLLLAGAACTAPWAAATITKEHTSIFVPAQASALPWSGGAGRPFLVPRSEVTAVDCGAVKTFLGSWYASERQDEVLSIPAYEAAYNATTGAHKISQAILRAALDSDGDKKVVLCSADNSVPVHIRTVTGQ